MANPSVAWIRVTELFDAVLPLDAGRRASYLAEACRDQPEIRRQVEMLLAAHDRAGTFLEHPAITFDDSVLDLTGQFVGPYRIDAHVGSGGMGDVYKAHDPRLNRVVALKLLPRHLSEDAERLRRFHAEACTASSLNHPNILVVHDFGEHDGRPFIATEFVEGETLRRRLASGALPTTELLTIGAQIASALAAAHDRGVLHRDVKPENVMIRPDGYVKVLDFGIAKLTVTDTNVTREAVDSRELLIVGTPQYMSPEQARGDPVDFRSDQFSLGALLYELATGRQVFKRGSAVESAAAVINAEPEPLERACPERPHALRRAIERCLAKQPANRYPSTRDLHRDLVEAAEAGRRQPATTTAGHAIIVLPLKILRGRPDADFLAFSLPDAVAASLAERRGIAVRSPLAAGRHGGAEADLGALAGEMAAQFALTGTLTCLDDRVAIRLQLLAIPSGTLLWSASRVAMLRELFDVQDTVAADVARALPADIGAPPGSDVPNDPGAYAFYLRANQLAYEVSRWHEARDLYRECLAVDPDYAPAWARVARCERLIGKFSSDPDEGERCLQRAEEAFERALALNPDLNVAHSLYAQLMIDTGRTNDATELLLRRLRDRPSDPQLYAGLVHALRYCGLLDASVAAHERARALDPSVPTSVHHTWWMRGEYERALAETFGDIGYMQGLALASLGREQDAISALRWRERETIERGVRSYLASLRAALEGNREKGLEALATASVLRIDAEARYYLARTFARLGEHDRAARELQRVVDGGFWCCDAFVRDPWLAPIRSCDEVVSSLERAHTRATAARSAFGSVPF
jgi:TolB-like protein/tetratricopeptide (TPR) repeat protein